MIYERLSDLKATYTDENPRSYRLEMIKCQNLEKLVHEPQASLIRNAINATEQQRPLIIRYYGGRNVPVELRDIQRKDLKFDFKPIDAALKEFEPASEMFLTQLPDL